MPGKEYDNSSKQITWHLSALTPSLTRTMVNTPKGNAIIERFFRSLKEECVWQHQFQNFDEAKKFVDEWVKKYNQERPHQALGYLTPAEFFEKTVRTAA